MSRGRPAGPGTELMPGHNAWSDRYFMRDFSRVVLTGRDCVIFVGGSNETIVHATDEPERWSSVLQELADARSGQSLAASESIPSDLNQDFLDRLVEAGHIVVADKRSSLVEERIHLLSTSPSFQLQPRPQTCDHLLLGCTGSVVSGLMAQSLLSLSYCGFQQQLDVILTKTASRFLTRDFLEAYGIRCWEDGFEQKDGIRVPHVTLARSADVIAVLPASANALNRVAHASCSDLLSLCITASEAPVVLAPAMNATMWNSPGVQRNLQILRRDRRFILEPAIIFGAADFSLDAPPMYGGHGTMWGGPLSLMQALAAVLDFGRTQQ